MISEYEARYRADERLRRRLWIATWIATGIFGLGFTAVLAISEARAHDAKPTAGQPLGWAYDYSCCSLMDCKEVKDTSVKEDGRGFTIAATGELIPYGDKRIKQSKDEFFHRCSHGGRESAGTICLYVPNRGI